MFSPHYSFVYRTLYIIFLGRRKRHFVANHTNQVYGNQKKKCDSKKKERKIIEKRGQFHNEKEHIQVIIKSCMHSLLCSKSPIQFFFAAILFPHTYSGSYEDGRAKVKKERTYLQTFDRRHSSKLKKYIFFFSP